MKSRGWFLVHSWLGVVAGLLLFVVCWSGTVATFSDEIDWLLNPAMRIEADAPRKSWEQLHDAVERAFPKDRVESLHLGPHAGFAVEAIVVTPEGQRLRVYVHPSSAKIQGDTTFFNVQRFFRSFHMGLFLKYPIGTYIVGFFGVVLALSTLAPLLFYKRWWKRFFELRRGHNTRALWSALHKLGGLWSVWFGLLIALTGIWYLVEQMSIDIADAQFVYPPMPQWQTQPGSQPLPLDVLVERAQQLRPELKISSISFARGENSQGVMFCGQAGHVLVRDCADRLYLDLNDGTVIKDRSVSDLSLLLRWVDTVDPLHFGDFAGLITQTIWFIFGLVLSALCLTGAYLHAGRLARESRSRRAHWPGMTAAIGVALLVLVASFGSGWFEIRNFGALVNGVREWPQVSTAAIFFIAGWIVMTLIALWMWVRLIPRSSALKVNKQ